MNRSLPSYVLGHPVKLVVGVLAIALSVVVGLLAPTLIGRAVDALADGFDARVLLRYAGALILVTLVQGLFSFTQRQVLVTLSRDVEYEIREDYFANLLDQPQSFYQQAYTGDLMARATNDLAAVRMLCGPAIMYSTNTVFTAIGAGVLMFHIHPTLTLWALSPLPLVAAVTRWIGRRIHVLFEGVQQQFSSLSSLVQENLGGVRVLRAFAREESEIDAFAVADREYLDRQRRLIRWNAAFHPSLQMLVGIGFALVLWKGVGAVRAGEISVGQLVAFQFFLSLLVWPMIAIGWVINLVERGRASMRRIREVLDAAPAIADAAGARDWRPASGGVEIRSLDLVYEDGARALEGIDVEVPSGSTLAIVGGTGSGKSTLLNVISRVVDPPPGTVLVDGHEVAAWKLAALRSVVAVVPQESFLFSATLRDNILWGNRDADEAAVEEAVAIAGLTRDLEQLPRGLDTSVGERGVTLSGGQRQRVAIARAVLRDARVLLLDDCLSAVDTETESRILARLRDHFEGRAVLLVSHRVTAARTADQVIVLERGRVVEQGAPEDLIDAGGPYSDLYRRQQLEMELEAV